MVVFCQTWEMVGTLRMTRFGLRLSVMEPKLQQVAATLLKSIIDFVVAKFTKSLVKHIVVYIK